MSHYRVETRPETPTVGITGTITMTEFAKVADRIPELVGWLAERGTHPGGAPFFRYHVIDMEYRAPRLPESYGPCGQLPKASSHLATS